MKRRRTPLPGSLVDRGELPREKSRGAREPKEARIHRDTHAWLYPDRSTEAPLLGPLDADHMYGTMATLNPVDVRHCTHMLDSECTLKTVSDIVISELLSGGVEVYRKGFTLSDSAREFYSMAWGSFARRLLRSLWATGIAFVAMEPHPVYRAIPHVLELSLLHVRFRTDRFGLRHYVVTDPSMTRFSPPMGIDSMGIDQPLPGLMVFEMDPPAADGRLQSKVRSLLPLIELQYGQLAADFDVLEQRRNPNMVLTEVPSYTTLRYNGAHGGPTPPTNAALSDTDPRQFAHTSARRTQRSLESAERELYGLGRRPPVSEQFHSAGRHSRFLVHRLEEGIEASFAPLPQEPQHLDVVLTLVEERVGSTFGVPRSLFSRSHGSYRTATAESSAQMLFKDTLRALKNFIVPIMNTVFLSIYNDVFVQDTVRTLILSDNIDAREIMTQSRVSWNFPGSPDLDIITRLYREGTLGHNFYRNALAHKLCIPLDQFESREIISRRELAGLPDTPAPDKEASSKPKGAAKSGIKPVGGKTVHSPFDMTKARTSVQNDA